MTVKPPYGSDLSPSTSDPHAPKAAERDDSRINDISKEPIVKANQSSNNPPSLKGRVTWSGILDILLTPVFYFASLISKLFSSSASYSEKEVEPVEIIVSETVLQGRANALQDLDEFSDLVTYFQEANDRKNLYQVDTQKTVQAIIIPINNAKFKINSSLDVKTVSRTLKETKESITKSLNLKDRFDSENHAETKDKVKAFKEVKALQNEIRVLIVRVKSDDLRRELMNLNGSIIKFLFSIDSSSVKEIEEALNEIKSERSRLQALIM